MEEEGSVLLLNLVLLTSRCRITTLKVTAGVLCEYSPPSKCHISNMDIKKYMVILKAFVYFI